MDHKDITIFLELVRCRNISKTAENLYLSQSAVSSRLKALEAEMGCQLVLRFKGQRSVELTLDCTDEMGTPCQKRLILELMGRNSNLILTDGENRILDCMRRVDFEMSEQRQVLPGLFYHRPPRQEGKLTPQELTKPALERLLAQTAAPVHLDRWIVDHVAGISPLIARELAFGFCGETDADVLTLDRTRLAEALTQPSLLQARQPTLLLCGGRPKDFTYCPIRQYSAYMTARTMPSFSACRSISSSSS